MNCKDALDLVHGYIDGEIDLVKSLEIEQHLAGCHACKVQFDGLRESGSSLRAYAGYHAAPAMLRERIAAALPADTRPASRARSRDWMSVMAPYAIAVSMMMAIVPLLMRPGAEERLAQEVVAGHVRSMLGAHLTDVTSSDQHTVKPWIAGKLDFSPPVRDLSRRGYVLAGGRLDYVEQRNVFALVYRQRQHVINLFIWPEERGSPLRQTGLRGYNLAHFAVDGMAYWAVSDLNADELKAFAELLRGKAGGAS